MHGFQGLCISLLICSTPGQRGSKGSVRIPLAVDLVNLSEKGETPLERLECHTCTYFDQSHPAGDTRSYRTCAIAAARPAA